MPDGARDTRTPRCWTASGNCDSTEASLFCTSTWANSGSVPLSNVNEIEAEPVLDDDSM